MNLSSMRLCYKPDEHIISSDWDDAADQDGLLPMMDTEMLGTLSYEHSIQLHADISAALSRNLFQEAGEWVCYRRNYLSCTCSFSTGVYYPGKRLFFTPSDSTTSLELSFFAMSISAVSSSNFHKKMNLDVYTSKRDRRNVYRAAKVPMYPVQASTDWPVVTHHTFDRMQFQSATRNNGKRRSAQEFYHFVVELWAKVCRQRWSDPEYVRVAIRKSEGIIVRGRSPSHYRGTPQRDESNVQSMTSHDRYSVDMPNTLRPEMLSGPVIPIHGGF